MTVIVFYVLPPFFTINGENCYMNKSELDNKVLNKLSVGCYPFDVIIWLAGMAASHKEEHKRTTEQILKDPFLKRIDHWKDVFWEEFFRVGHEKVFLREGEFIRTSSIRRVCKVCQKEKARNKRNFRRSESGFKWTCKKCEDDKR